MRQDIIAAAIRGYLRGQKFDPTPERVDELAGLIHDHLASSGYAASTPEVVVRISVQPGGDGDALVDELRREVAHLRVELREEAA